MLHPKVALLVSLCATALAAPVSTNATNGVISVPLKKVKEAGHHNSTKRALADEQLDFTGIRYFAEYTVGGQSQSAILDTGSSDTWTFSNEAWSGGYNPSLSQTYQWQNDNFDAGYGDGDNSVTGTWATETVEIGGAEVQNYPFAVVNEASNNFPDNRGIFAIGPKAAETTDQKYATFVERLKDAGQVQSNSYSLYSDASNNEATLLLGGIDTAKFQSPLYTLAFDTETNEGQYFQIDFSFEGTRYTGGLLDTGTPQILLPSDVVSEVAARYGAESDDGTNYYRYSPPAADAPGLDFEIGGVKITIPGSDMFTQEDETTYSFALAASFEENEGAAINTLGDPILKQLYLFYDIDKNQIAFAPIIQTTSSNLVPVGDTIPNSVAAPDQTEGDSGNSSNGNDGDGNDGDGGDGDGGDGDGGNGNGGSNCFLFFCL